MPRPSYVSSNADLDYNVVWVKEMLKLDTNCDLQTVGKSIDYNMVFSFKTCVTFTQNTFYHIHMNTLNLTLYHIVLFAQTYLKSQVYTEIYSHFNDCGKPNPPILTVTGDTHPKNYCMQRDSRFANNNNEIYLTIEAFSSGPIHVFVVRDPDNPDNDYFHVKDTQTSATNRLCASYFGP